SIKPGRQWAFTPSRWRLLSSWRAKVFFSLIFNSTNPVVERGGEIFLHLMLPTSDGNSKYTTVVVGRASAFKQELHVNLPSKLSWEFVTEQHDIKFALYRKINEF